MQNIHINNTSIYVCSYENDLCGIRQVKHTILWFGKKTIFKINNVEIVLLILKNKTSK